MTGFWLAVPFMIILLFLSFPKSLTYKIASTLFVTVCIGINLTIYKNPLVFPGLSGDKEIEIAKNSFYESYSDKSGRFIASEKDVYINEPSEAQKE